MSRLSAGLAHNRSLSALRMSDCGIDARGASSLAAALQANATLGELDLLGNKVGDAGAAALVGTLATNRSLYVLGLFRPAPSWMGDIFADKASKGVSSGVLAALRRDAARRGVLVGNV